MENRKKEIFIISIAIILQTAIYIFCGIQKSYIHMDEAYSLGLASYDKVEIQDSEDFYNTWHGAEYYEDYLSVQDDEIGEYRQVYENQKNDVHPPLYYLFLRFAMGFTKGHYSKWSGITINIIIFAFITILLYEIIKKLLDGENKYKEKSIILAFVASITMASLTNVIYIRMYALSTFNILLTAFLHIKLLENEKASTNLQDKLLESEKASKNLQNILSENEKKASNSHDKQIENSSKLASVKISTKILVAIGISALIGSLTHYYYLFFLSMMYLIFAIRFIKQKEWKNVIYYTLTMGLAAVTSLTIFPYSIQHMFFGYRGQGVMDKLKDVPQFIGNIAAYIEKINRFGFNNLLYAIIIAIIGGSIFSKVYHKEKSLKNESKSNEVKNHEVKSNEEKSNENLKQKPNTSNKEKMQLLIFPTLFYSVLVAISSPWIELRYIMPVCILIFIIVFYYLYELFKKLFKEKTSNILMVIVLILVLIAPAFFKIEPEVMFSDKKEIVEKLGNELNVPTLYWFNSGNNRFLDDILLFSEIKESYVAKDIEPTIQNIQAILTKKDITKGMVVFINEGQENDEILKQIVQATGLQKWEYLKRLNACDVYYIK